MGKTYRHTPESSYLKPKKNRARKGKVIPKDLSLSEEDPQFDLIEDDWNFYHTGREYDPDFKKKMKKLKVEGRKMRGKDDF